jgi:N-terminal domain on NACHT_NTPase and P-loop NTPases
MDPITCLGIASALVQFVDFGTKIISEAKELYTSVHGASAENFELESITSDLSQLSKKLSLPTSGEQVTDDEKELRKVAGSCKEVANELLEALHEIKVVGAHRKWQSFRQALRNVMKREKIQSISARLERLQKQVQLRLINILRYVI